MYLIYKVYQLGRNASATLSLLSLGLERKVKCYNEYFFNEYVFHTGEHGQGRKTYNNGVSVKRSTSSDYEVDYYKKLKEVIELQYHNKHNIVFLFKCYWYDNTDKWIRVDLHPGLVKINSKARSVMSTISLFSPSNASKFITHTPLPLERIVQSLLVLCQGCLGWERWLKYGRWCISS